jgi:hypothetical protein
MKRTKNQGFGIVVKAQISISYEISLRGALFCSLLNSLILSVICCAASDKPLAFQFANKTQQSQGQKLILNWDLGFINELRFLFFSLMKRTKNQGFGIVVKAQISNL